MSESNSLVYSDRQIFSTVRKRASSGELGAEGKLERWGSRPPGRLVALFVYLDTSSHGVIFLQESFTTTTEVETPIGIESTR